MSSPSGGRGRARGLRGSGVVHVDGQPTDAPIEQLLADPTEQATAQLVTPGRVGRAPEEVDDLLHDRTYAAIGPVTSDEMATKWHTTAATTSTCQTSW